MAIRKNKNGLFKGVDYTLMIVVGLITFGILAVSGTLIWLLLTL